MSLSYETLLVYLVGWGVLLFLLSCLYGYLMQPRRALPKLSQEAIEELKRAVAAHKQENWDLAQEAYTKVLEHNPQSTEALFNRAIIYARQANWDGVISDCNSILTLVPGEARAYRLRGIAFRSRAEFDPALNDFCKALELEPNYMRAHYDRGLMYSLIPDLKKAYNDVSEAILLGEKGARGLEGLTSAKAKESAGFIERGLLPQCYSFRGWLAYGQGDVAGAIADLSAAINLAPNEARLYYKRGFYYHTNGDYAEAIASKEKALELKEDLAIAHNGLAWLLATCEKAEFRDGARALRHAMRAMELEMKLAYMGTIAAANAEAGNFGEAVRWATEFLNSKPPTENIEMGLYRLNLYQSGQPYREPKGRLETVVDISL